MPEIVTAWRPEDLAAAAELYADVFNAEPWNDRWTIETATARLRDLQNTPGFEGAVLRRDGLLLAFAAGHRQRWYDDSDHFYLAEFAVTRGEQRRGHGTLLLREFLGALSGVTRCYLLTEVEGDAGMFYQRSGFRPARRQGVMVRDPAQVS